MRKLAPALLALAILAIGAYLRFESLGAPSYWLDEVLGQRLTSEALEKPWWRWVTGWEAEHGPLYYATQVVSRVAGDDEFAGRLPAAIFGVVTIGVVWLAAKRFDALAALASTALLALSPFHVYYSREARPYALVMLLTAVLLVLLLRGDSPWRVTLVLVAMLYTSATAAPVVAATFVWSAAALAAALLFGAPDRKAAAQAAALQTVITTAFLLLYRQPPGETPGVPFPPFDGALFGSMLRSFTVSAFGTDVKGRTVFALAAFAIIGAIVLFRRDRRAAMVVMAMTLLPVTFVLASLKITGHWFALRYIGPGLIGFVVLAGAGIAAVAVFIGRRKPFAYAATVLVIVLIGVETWPAARREAFQKLDWRGIASKIVQYARAGDLVIAAETSTGIISDYYLARQRAHGVIDVQTSLPPIAEQLRSEHPATFVLTTNAPGDAPMREWTCRHPLILASPIDSFRMHYTGDFLRERAQAPEHRAAMAGIGDAAIYGEGWGGVEGTGADAFRWAIGEQATLLVPRDKDARPLQLRIAPVEHPALPQQTVRIAINGRVARELAMQSGWSDHTLDVPPGMNVVTLTFGRATAPSAVDPKSGDTRRLAAAVQLPRERAMQTRIASLPLLDENATWRRTHTNLPHERLRRDAVIPLLGRLGFDPATVWPRIARGELHLDALAESIAHGSECHDDATFLRHAYDLLLDRAPSPGEKLTTTRVRFVGRLVKSDEFRARVLR